MRLAGPQQDTYLSKAREFFSRGTTKRQKLLKAVTVLIITVLILSVWAAIFRNEKRQNTQPKNASDAAIEELKKSSETRDMRSLTSVYAGVDKYPEAIESARKVAQKTGAVEDYIGLLSVCAQSNEPNKQACLDEVAAKLKPQLDKLSFFNVYSVGSLFDDGGDKKNAVIFYQRAYDIYDPKRADEYTKTKEQLKKRIDDLSK